MRKVKSFSLLTAMAFAACGSNSIKIEIFDLMGNTLFSKIFAESNSTAYQMDIPEIFSFQLLLNFATRSRQKTVKRSLRKKP